MDGSACGKVILLGEHAVVHGSAALVGALDRGVRARAEPGDPELHIPGLEPIRPDDGTELGRAFGELLGHVPASACTRVTAWFDVPTGAGLGSSAAWAVAVMRALGADEPTVARAALASEAIFHGSPSGIDTEAARRGTLGIYSRQLGWRSLASPPLTLCIGMTGQARATRTMVGKVMGALERAPQSTRDLLARVSSLVASAEQALSAGDLELLGRLMNANHECLRDLGVSSSELDALVDIARHEGALGAKLTGAGGGGAMIALAPKNETRVLSAWRSAGYTGFLSQMGANGWGDAQRPDARGPFSMKRRGP